MQFEIIFDLFFQLFVYATITALVLGWQLWRYVNSDVRTQIRVHHKGGTEKRYSAVEVGEELQWVQSGERMSALIPEGVFPGHTQHWGIPYRIFNVIDGGDEAIMPPWLEAKELKKATGGEPAAKERYRRRVRAADSFRQIAAGLRGLNRWQAVAILFLGFFAGLYLAPYIGGLLAG